MDYPILPMHPRNWPAVREIYREGIATGDATFEIVLPDWEKWDSSHRKDLSASSFGTVRGRLPNCLASLQSCL